MFDSERPTNGLIITTIIVNLDVNYCQSLGSVLVAMMNGHSSSEFWSIIPSLMQAWIRYYIPSLLVCLRSLLPPIIFKCSSNRFFNELSLWLLSMNLRKAYIHRIGFDAYALGRCSRCVNNNTSVKNIFLNVYLHSM